MTDKLKELATECKERDIDFNDVSPNQGSTSCDKLVRHYIAAASPDVVLALIKRAEDSESQLEFSNNVALPASRKEADTARRECSILRAEVERLTGELEIKSEWLKEAHESDLRLQARVNAMEGQTQLAHKTLQDVLASVKSWNNDDDLVWMQYRLPEVIASLAPGAAPKPEWATFLHYPQCWDTAAYPTLEDAIHEALAWSGCSVCREAAQAAPKPTLYRLMHKEGAAWIPASEWMTEADATWVKLAQDKPDEWCIKEPLDGKKVADAFRTAFAQAAPKGEQE